MNRQFKILDDDGNRKLSLPEFMKGCRDFGADLSKQEAQDVFNLIDKDHNGSIEFDEFLKALRVIPDSYFDSMQPPMNASRRRIIKQAFMKLDRTRDGLIRIEDLKGVYNCKNHPKYINGDMTEEDIFREFLKTFQDASTADDTVTEDEFFNYYSGVSASIDNDAYFDLMIRNAYKL